MFVQPKFTPDDITRQDCQFDVSHPGRFESCHIATPYMWNRIMQWGESPDYDCYDRLGWEIGAGNESDFENLPLVFRYEVDIQDIANFPELNGIACVFMWQDDSGFIYDHIVELESIPLAITLHYAQMQTVNDLMTAVEYTLAILGIEPQASTMAKVSTDLLFRIREALVFGIIARYQQD